MADIREVGRCGSCGGHVLTDGTGLWCDSCENDWFPGTAIPEDMVPEASEDSAGK